MEVQRPVDRASLSRNRFRRLLRHEPDSMGGAVLCRHSLWDPGKLNFWLRIFYFCPSTFLFLWFSFSFFFLSFFFLFYFLYHFFLFFSYFFLIFRRVLEGVSVLAKSRRRENAELFGVMTCLSRRLLQDCLFDAKGNLFFALKSSF